MRMRQVVRAVRAVQAPSPLFGGRKSSRARRPVIVNEALGDDSGTATAWPQHVEEWRSDVQDQAGTKPIEFLLAWIKIESAGSVCSWTTLQEAGIFQLMAGDNIAEGGTTIALQHPVPPCTANAGSYVWRTMVSDDIAHEQVRGGLQYVDYCVTYAEAQMAANGYLDQPGWTDSDWSYWAMVKMVHVAPAMLGKMMQQGLSGYGSVPPDWDTMMGYVSGIPTNWTDNARTVGINGQGGGSVLNALTSNTMMTYALLGGGALLLLYLLKKDGKLAGIGL